MGKYIIGIDQSTQGTKALLFDGQGRLVCRTDAPHRQIINEQGWVEHDPEEIWVNTLKVVRALVEKAGIDKGDIVAMGISNQRETAACWYRDSGKPAYNAIVWQCARGAGICEELEAKGAAETVRKKTGLRLSPYFSAAKWAWLFRNVKEVRDAAEAGNLCIGTVDSYLVYRLTGGREHRTDHSNASRTQLFNLSELRWDRELTALFGIPEGCLPAVTDSDGIYGETDFDGWLEKPIPIRAVMGDSHGALFGQGCTEKGMIKATYGTGSSIMMNIGETPVFPESGVVTSIAWGMKGKVSYVLEGNINYTGAVISWLKDDVGLISSAGETEGLAMGANPADTTCLVPAFTGLGAPYWDPDAKAALTGMSRTTGKKEIVRAALDCIAYQVDDVVTAMGQEIRELRVDGGPTRNRYLMQYQSDLLGKTVSVPDTEELSGTGVAWAAGIAAGLYDGQVFDSLKREIYEPAMTGEIRTEKRALWRDAVSRVRGTV